MPARIHVRLTPRSGRDGIDRIEGEVVHARVRPAPTDGAANAALIALLADALQVPKSSLSLLAGHRSRLKVVGADSVDAETALGRLRSFAETALKRPKPEAP